MSIEVAKSLDELNVSKSAVCIRESFLGNNETRLYPCYQTGQYVRIAIYEGILCIKELEVHGRLNVPTRNDNPVYP